MKIAWVSSWPPRPCGIATYSQELVEEIRRLGHEVFIICHLDGGKKKEEGVYPVIQLDKPEWGEELYRVVTKINPHLVHIQHEYGLYSRDNDFSSGLIPPLYRWSIEEKFPLVMTYHSVYSRLGKKRALYMDITLRIIQAGIVHEEYQKISLPYNLGWVPQNVWVIPHGAKKIINPHSKKRAREKLGLGGKKVVGMIGWFIPIKGYHRVINLWQKISSKLPDTILVLAGETRQPSGENYKRELMELILKSKVKEKIKIILKVLQPEEYDLILSAFDLVVLPYTFASQSGNLAHAFSLGVPAVVSALEGLKEEIEKSRAGIAVPPDDDEELKRAILRMMEDERLREECSRRAKQYVEDKINWQKIAQQHINLYQKLLGK